MMEDSKSRVGPKNLTHADWVQAVAERGRGLFTAVSHYQHNQTPVSIRHNVCGTVFKKKPNDWKRVPTCPVCNPVGSRSKPSSGTSLTLGQAQARLDEKFGEGQYQIIGSYTNTKTKTTVRHCACGHEWDVALGLMFKQRPSTCPKCSRKWTKERFQQAISKSFEGSEYEVVGPYLGSNAPTEVKHVSCGNIWFVTPNNFLNGGTRCPACSTPRNSKLSRTVHKALIETLGGLELRREYVFQGDGAPVSVGGRSLSFDFWIPGLKLLIEADGLLHDLPWNDAHGRSKLAAQQANDRIKNEWAERVGYTLFRIPHHHPNWKTAVQEAVRLARDRQTSSE